MLKRSSAQRKWFNLLVVLTRKILQARYKPLFLGFVWMVVHPLIQMVVLGLVFHFFIKVEVENYFMFLFTGLLPWHFFSTSLNNGVNAVVIQRSMLQKAKLSRELLVLSEVAANLVHLLISLGILLILVVLNQLVSKQVNLVDLMLSIGQTLWVLPFVVWLVVFTGGLSLGLAALNVKYRDISLVVQTVLTVLIYGTPVIYTLDIFPAAWQRLWYLNPLTPIIEGFHFAYLRIPISFVFLGVIQLFLSLIISVLGWKYFQKESRWFNDRL